MGQYRSLQKTIEVVITNGCYQLPCYALYNLKIFSTVKQLGDVPYFTDSKK